MRINGVERQMALAELSSLTWNANKFLEAKRIFDSLAEDLTNPPTNKDNKSMMITTVVHSATPTDYYRVMPSCVESRPVYVLEYRLVKETPFYVYIKLKGDLYDKPRKMLKGARKQFASPTLEEAYRSFVIRSEKYIKILGSKIADRRHQMTYVKKLLDGHKENK
jgi:hypothetical protein